jgi:hypothetical protein
MLCRASMASSSVRQVRSYNRRMRRWMKMKACRYAVVPYSASIEQDGRLKELWIMDVRNFATGHHGIRCVMAYGIIVEEASTETRGKGECSTAYIDTMIACAVCLQAVARTVLPE